MLGSLSHSILSRFHRRKISYRVSLLICFFASCSWLAVDGIFVEQALLVENLPEQWQLPSYIAIIIQLANIGPLFYTAVTKICPKKVKEIPVIFSLMILGVIALLILIFSWHETVQIQNRDVSFFFFLSVFLISLMSCTTSVTFFPYMSRFKQNYFTPFFIGQGLGGLIPSMFALSQGIQYTERFCLTVNATDVSNSSITHENQQQKQPTTPPRFSISVYFLLLLVMIVISMICFLGLNTLTIARNEKVKHKKEMHRREHLDKSVPSINSSVVTWNKDGSLEHLNVSHVEFCSINPEVPDERCSENLVYQETVEEGCSSILTQKEIYILLFVQAWINACSNGIFPSISSYAALPYGTNIFHLLITLSMVADPIACALHSWLPMTSVRKICTGSLLYTLLIGYFVILALLSPCPFFVNESVGGPITVSICDVLWEKGISQDVDLKNQIIGAVLATGLVSYNRLAISSNLHSVGKKALFHMGIAIQVGSSLGALSFFLLVNYSSLFTQSHDCQTQCV